MCGSITIIISWRITGKQKIPATSVGITFMVIIFFISITVFVLRPNYSEFNSLLRFFKILILRFF